MKIVLDTNVLISGVFFSGYPQKILQAWKTKIIQFVITPDIYSEYERVSEYLSRSYPDIDITRILNLIALYSDTVQPVQLPGQICEDPDDDKFIACAIAGKVDCIISGDKHLLTIEKYDGIQIVKPRDFCIKVLRQSDD